MNHEQVADRVIKYVGKDNLIAAAHCATRLRLVVKDVKKMAEEAKVAARNVRRDEMDEAKAKLKNKEISEDEEKALEDTIQKETDKYVAKIDEIADKKEKEIMSV